MRSFDIVMSAHLDHSDHVASTGHSNRSGIFQSMSSSSWGCLSWLTCFFPSNLHSTPPSQWIPIMCFILGQYTGTRFICQLHWFHFIPKLCKDFAGGNFLLRKGMVRAAFDVLFSHVRTHTIRSQAGIVYNGLSVHTDVHLFLQPNNACVVMESRLSTWKDEQFCSIRIKWIRRLSIEHAKCVGVWQLVNDNNMSTFLDAFLSSSPPLWGRFGSFWSAAERIGRCLCQVLSTSAGQCRGDTRGGVPPRLRGLGRILRLAACGFFGNGLFNECIPSN